MVNRKKPVLSLIIALLSWTGVGVVVWKMPPGWWSEAVAISLLVVALILTVSWVIGKRKLGILVAVAMVGLLLMQRFRILDWTTFGIWLVGLGLITFVN